MGDAREATSISGLPRGQNGEDGVYYAVGCPYWQTVENTVLKLGNVTRIAVTCDLPGLHCDMERVRVYDGDTVIYEAPLHNLEGIAYAHPNRTENPFT